MVAIFGGFFMLMDDLWQDNQRQCYVLIKLNGGYVLDTGYVITNKLQSIHY